VIGRSGVVVYGYGMWRECVQRIFIIKRLQIGFIFLKPAMGFLLYAFHLKAK